MKRTGKPARKQKSPRPPRRDPLDDILEAFDPRLARVAAGADAPMTEEDRKAILSEIEGKSFREVWRAWLLTPEVIFHQRKMALMPTGDGIRMLTALIQKAYPTPLGFKMQDDGPKAIRILLGKDAATIELGYKAQGPVPGMERAAEVASRGEGG